MWEGDGTFCMCICASWFCSHITNTSKTSNVPIFDPIYSSIMDFPLLRLLLSSQIIYEMTMIRHQIMCARSFCRSLTKTKYTVLPSNWTTFICIRKIIYIFLDFFFCLLYLVDECLCSFYKHHRLTEATQFFDSKLNIKFLLQIIVCFIKKMELNINHFLCVHWTSIDICESWIIWLMNQMQTHLSIEKNG